MVELAERQRVATEKTPIASNINPAAMWPNTSNTTPHGGRPTLPMSVRARPDWDRAC
jgi:hypothetical protein